MSSSSGMGGVGIIFRKDEGDERFLVVHKVVSGGPADVCGVIRSGDRLNEIDGISLGAPSGERPPQLPGAHMSPVVLTFSRDSMGSGAKRYSVDLFRSKDFFPDKLLTDSALRSDKDKDKERASIGSSSSSMRASERDRMSIQPKISGSGSYKSSMAPSSNGISPPPRPDETASSGYHAAPTLDDPIRPSRARPSIGWEERAQTESERCRMLEGKVIDLTLDLERARDAIEMERQRSLEALAKQAMELRKEREANESRLVASMAESGKDADQMRAKMLDMNKVIKRLEKEMEALTKERNELQEAFLEHSKGASAEASKAHRQELARIQQEEAKKREQLREELEQMLSEREAELDALRAKSHMHHVKTTGAMRALTEDLKEARGERDALAIQLQEANMRTADAIDVRAADKLNKELDEAYGIIAGMKKDHARLEAALEHALAETHDAIAAREKLARDVVLARAGIAISAQDASPSLLDEKPAPKRAVDAVDKIVEQALAREAALRTPTTSAKPRGESPQKRVPPPEEYVSAVQDPDVDATFDIMRLYLGDATPRPALENASASLSPSPEKSKKIAKSAPQVHIRVQIVRTRNIPTTGDEAQLFFRLSLGGAESETVRRAKTSDVKWDQTFDMAAPAPGSEEMVTILLVEVPSTGGEEMLVGYVAVPVSRIRSTGQESGWYLIRTEDDKLVKGEEGNAEALLRLTLVDDKANESNSSVGVLECELLAGKGLGPLEGGTRDAYVVVQIAGQQRRTGVVKRTGAPQWGERFSLSVGGIGELCSLMVWDANPESLDPYVGHIAIPIKRVSEQGQEEGWYDVRNQAGNVVTDSTGTDAQVWARFTYSKAPEGAQAPLSGWLSKEGISRFFVLDPHASKLTMFNAKEDAELGARPSWEVSTTLCGCAATPGDEFSLDIFSGEDGEQNVCLKADNEEERDTWVSAIRRAAGPPLDPYAPSKREMNSPSKQLQEAIKKDMEESDKRHKEADQNELGEKQERITKDEEQRMRGAERERERAKEAEQRAVKEREEKEAKEREEKIRRDKELLEMMEKEKAAATEARKTRQREAEEQEAAAKEKRERAVQERALAAASAVEDSIVQKVDAVMEAYILKGRNLPLNLKSVVVALQVAAPGNSPSVVTSTKLADASDIPVWNESFQFAVPAGGGSDLVTLVVWSVTDGNKRENIGHIAVPASRVASTGKEEGWYEVRTADGQILTGGEKEAKSAVLVSLTYRVVDEALPAQHGWCYTRGKDNSSFVKRYAVLDPYRQTISTFENEESARSCQGESFEFNLRACSSDVEAATKAIDAAQSKGAGIPQSVMSNDGAFHVTTHFGEWAAVFNSRQEADNWRTAALRVGNPSTLKRMPAPPKAQVLAAADPSKSLSKADEAAGNGIPLKVSIERGRNMPEAGDATLHCILQVGSHKSSVTQRVQSDALVRWNESFDVFANAPSDLIAIMLMSVKGGGDPVPVGHIAVPVARVQATSKEEGWYEVRSKGGVVVTSEDGKKTSVLIRMSVA